MARQGFRGLHSRAVSLALPATLRGPCPGTYGLERPPTNMLGVLKNTLSECPTHQARGCAQWSLGNRVSTWPSLFCGRDRDHLAKSFYHTFPFLMHEVGEVTPNEIGAPLRFPGFKKKRAFFSAQAACTERLPRKGGVEVYGSR